MRFLTHELDGRNRLHHVQEHLSGMMIRPMAVAYAGASANRPAPRERSAQPLRRWLQSRIDGLRRAGRLA